MKNVRKQRVRRSMATALTAGALAVGALAPAVIAPLSASAAPMTAAIGRSVGEKSTFNSGLVGQCTWGAMNFWHDATGYYPNIQGNALDWAADAARKGWTVTDVPLGRSLVVFQPNVYLASPFFGHVGWVDWVEYRPDGAYVHGRQVDGPSPTFVFKSIPGMSYILAP